nr:MAG TPA: Receptor Binding Protein [Caudoviricetes sp.]
MEKSSFFNSVGGDRVYNAENWAEYFSSFIGNGVFPSPSTNLQVVTGDGMTITIRAGKAWINGYFYFNTNDLSITLATADGVLNRIDRIVIRWDLTNRIISAAVKSSTPSASPSAPALQRDADAYELCIADVLVGAGVTAVTQGNITDQRLNAALCGVVAGVVTQIDTAAFNAQLQAWFTEYQDLSLQEYNDLVSYFDSLRLQGDQQYAALQAYMNAFKVDAENDFNAWFAALQNVLDENTAGHLLNLIQNNTARIEIIEAVLFNDITTNPFLILFDDLEGVVATGVWNAALERIEC